MENTNQLILRLNSIFDTIEIIYDKTSYTFDKCAVIIQNFQIDLESAENFQTNEIAKEFWSATSEIKREEQITKLWAKKFERLQAWSQRAKDINELNSQIYKDIDYFFYKQAKISITYQPSDKAIIRNLFSTISHRLMKLNYDLIKEKAVIMKMVEAEKERNQSSGVNIYVANNIKLHPDKTTEFCAIIDQLYDIGFFIPIDKTNPYTKTELFHAFGQWLHSDFSVALNTITQPNMINKELPPPNGKSFPEYLLHADKYKLAEEIKNEFSTAKGKAIRQLLYVLENQNPPLITIAYRQAKELYNAISHYFDRNIGTYQSIFNYKVDDDIDCDDLDKIKIGLDHIMAKL